MTTIKRFSTVSSIAATAMAGWAFTAPLLTAAPIATLSSEAPGDGNTNNHVGAIQATVGDLLETVGSVAGQSNAVPTQHVTASLFNGKISTGTANGANGGDPDAPNAAGYYGTGHFIEFNLDTTTNTQGYDISAINIIQRGDSFRGGINAVVSVRQVGGSYTPLIAPPDAGTPGNVNMYAITNDSGPLIASGIDGVRFDFTNTATGSISGWTWYRELDVIGTPTGGPTDTTPPTLAASDIVDDQGGGPVVQNTLVTYTVTFSEDMNAGTVSADDFSNAGTALVSFGAIVETSPGVFSVAVTPTSAGTLRLQVPVGATMTDVAGNPLNTTSAIPDDTEITVNSETTPPTLASSDIVDDQGGGPVVQNTLVTYTVTFSEDMNADTVSADDFSNAGTASVSFGAIVETSPGVFSVAVTPTSAGTLRLQVPVGATMTDVAGNPLNTTSAIPDDTEITVEAAAVIATLTSEAANGSPHAGPLVTAVSGDLLETVGSVASESVGGAVPTQHVTASLFDGKITTGTANGANSGDPDAPNAAGYYGTGHFIEFDLDTTTNTLGYDISLIQIIQRGDSFRPGIHVTVSLRQVGGSYTTLISPPDAGTGGNVNMYAITSGSGPLIASGIDGIRFDFSNTVGTISGWTWYRELDVIGTPTGGGASYAGWAATHAPTTGSNPNADEDGDGVSNGVEYVLGGSKDTNDTGQLPQSSIDGADLVFTFVRDQASIDGSTAVTIEVSTDLVGWTAGDSPYAVPAAAASNNPGVSVAKDSPVAGKDTVTLRIPRAPDAAKFARLKVTVPGS